MGSVSENHTHVKPMTFKGAMSSIQVTAAEGGGSGVCGIVGAENGALEF